jgi:hypothetical protein
MITKEEKEQLSQFSQSYFWLDQAVALTQHPDYRVKGLSEAALRKFLSGDRDTAEQWFGFAIRHYEDAVLDNAGMR